MDEPERVHQLLTAAAEPPGPPIVPPGPELVLRARRRRQQRQGTAAIVTALLTVAAVVTPTALLHTSHRPAPFVATQSSLPTGAAAPSSLLPEFGVASPLLALPIGPAPQDQPICRAPDVTGRAELRPSPYGVVAVVRLRGHRCSLDVEAASMTLLDRAARPLAVPTRGEANANPGGLVRPDLAQAVGLVDVGFAWRGSWCGPKPASVRLVAVAKPVQARTTVSLPLSGRPPACAKAAGSFGYIVPGLVGAPHAPVQTAPPAWGALRARLELPASTAGSDERVSYRVVLHNAGNKPVTLSPCPYYSVVVAGRTQASSHGAAGDMVGASGGMLPCGRLLPPGGSWSLPLVLDTSGGPFAPGVVRVEWAMAGVPTASGTVRIR